MQSVGTRVYESFTNIEDINREILLNIDIQDILTIIDINQNNKQLLKTILPQILRSAFSKTYAYRADMLDDLKDITIELIYRGEIDLVKIIINEVTNKYKYFNIYDDLFVMSYNIANEKMIEYLLLAAPMNHDWTSIYRRIEDQILMRQNDFNDLSDFFLSFLRPAIKVKSIPILINLINHFSVYDKFLTRRYSETQINTYQDILDTKLSPLIRTANLIVSVQTLIDAWQEARPDYPQLKDTMDDIVDHLKRINKHI